MRHALRERGDRRGREITRARLSRMTLKRLWCREVLTEAWLAEVNEWLLSAGWTLVFAGKKFGVVKTSVVENWPRVASKHVSAVIDKVVKGTYDFSKLEDQLGSAVAAGDADEMDG